MTRGERASPPRIAKQLTSKAVVVLLVSAAQLPMGAELSCTHPIQTTTAKCSTETLPCPCSGTASSRLGGPLVSADRPGDHRGLSASAGEKHRTLHSFQFTLEWAYLSSTRWIGSPAGAADLRHEAAEQRGLGKWGRAGDSAGAALHARRWRTGGRSREQATAGTHRLAYPFAEATRAPHSSCSSGVRVLCSVRKTCQFIFSCFR